MRASCGHVGAVVVIGTTGALVCSRCDAPMLASATKHYTQHDADRPCRGKTKYLRTWKRARDEGDAEAWAEGRDRCMTAACWARWARTTTKPRARVVKLEPKKNSTTDLVLAELGATRRAG